MIPATSIVCPACGRELHVSIPDRKERPRIRTTIGNHLRSMHATLSVRERSLLADLVTEAIPC